MIEDDSKGEKGTFVPEGHTEEGYTIGTLWKEDGSASSVYVKPLVPGEQPDDTNDVGLIRKREGTPFYDVRMQQAAKDKRGWSAAYDTGWDRIFGRDTAPVGEA